MTGYLNRKYAESLVEFGEPVYLPKCRGWIIKRKIVDTDLYDATGCYPLFSCVRWSELAADMDALAKDFVTLSLVTDPFGEVTQNILEHSFRDLVSRFKEHYVTDLSRNPDVLLDKHHRYYLRKAERKVWVECTLTPIQFLSEWENLYDNLILRHHLEGIKAFSRQAFERQLSTPGVVMFRAIASGKAVAAHIWYVQGEVAYSHLAASSQIGYELMASYPLYWAAITYFRDKVRWLDLGGGAGIGRTEEDGLSRFKKGWATGTRTAYFCGRIFNAQLYARLAEIHKAGSINYFPAYRLREFS